MERRVTMYENFPVTSGVHYADYGFLTPNFSIFADDLAVQRITMRIASAG